uniref:Salicylic acid methyltransferase n=1 Tax=Conocephalum salebrosum TaxID=357981 RepID=A0A4P8W0C9_9MARC|nr:salicylic acid methyltransferase [Conocephalum salebrosum]
MGPDGTSSNSSPAFGIQGMTQGEGENSYTKNSSVQATLMRKILPKFFDVMKSMTLPDPDGAFRIADLGCSSGPNTVANVEAIIEQVRASYKEEGLGDSVPEIQVYFQDLPTNDFNTLFKHLFAQPNSEVETVRNYMSAAVPGSYCDRLFPKSTINIAMSSFALHWLAQVPDAVRDRESPAYNGGHTDIYRSSLATIQAYAEQADKDLDNFLAARAHEVAPGGLIFLTFAIRQSEFPYIYEPTIHLQEEVWNALVLEDVVSAEVRDSYNIPYYFRTLEDVNKQVEKYGSVFEVQKEEVIKLNDDLSLMGTENLREAARARVNVNRGTSTGYFEAFFGKTATDLFYERWEDAIYEQLLLWQSGQEQVGIKKPKSVDMLALGLRRK